ncbi:hypothetical protein MLD38_001481 [Melastoma candidum]|uniref:Uncharacterized protein n=1 Tax=Melastoma candidum TaxID=119954 RepID=A0ACB9SDG2_9MYRT|nr:hypothetical protein MLD38_001481 [Melastoma candidum]
MNMDSHIEQILWTPEQISDRVSELAVQVTEYFKDEDPSPVIIGVATGAFLFVADLVRKIPLPIAVDFIRSDSYGCGTQSTGEPSISLDLKIDIRGRHAILVEDIVDTGHTLSCLIDLMKSRGALSVSVCTFLNKSVRRKVQLQLVGDGKFFCGFECPDYFVVGYGMDYAEKYRNLPYIGVLKPELYG